MGFTSQPPLSSLGARGGFVPGAPPTQGWREEDVAASVSTAPLAPPTALVPPAVPSPTASIAPQAVPPTPANVTVFNPGAIAHTGTLAMPLVGHPSPAQFAPSAAPQRVVGGVPVSTPSPSASTVTSLRGRERYCSGGAWVGPAPGWPKPPASATIENTDVSRVRQNKLSIVNTLREKYQLAMQGAPPMKLKELEGISNKIGGLFVFLNNTGAAAGADDENTITEPVVEALVTLSDCLASGNTPAVNSILLHLSQKHWEEVSYWFPALKRLARFAAGG